MNEDVLQIMENLYPPLYTRYTVEQINPVIDISRVITADNGLTGTTADLGIALMSLDILFIPERSNVTSKRIKGVEIEYSNSKGSSSKWKAMYDSLVDGVLYSELSIHYTGI